MLSNIEQVDVGSNEGSKRVLQAPVLDSTPQSHHQNETGNFQLLAWFASFSGCKKTVLDYLWVHPPPSFDTGVAIQKVLAFCGMSVSKMCHCQFPCIASFGKVRKTV